MTLHDRIMGLIPDDITNGGEEFYDGFAEASRKAATIAKEADELMAEMATHILELIDAIETDEIIYESIVVRHLAMETVDRYNAYKERKQ